MGNPLSIEIIFLSLLSEIEVSDPSILSGNKYFTFRILGIVLLLILSGFFDSANSSLSLFNKVKARELMEKGFSGASSLNRLLENRVYTLNTLFIINLLSILLINNLFCNIICEFFPLNLVNLFLITIFMTASILFFWKIVFRTIRTYNLQKFSLVIARPVEFIIFIFYPFSWVLIKICNFIDKLFGIDNDMQEHSIKQDHIKLLVEQGEEQGVFQEQEKEMIRSIIDFGDTIAREIMVPRISMVCIEVNETIKDMVNKILENSYSRIPIYEETIDNIIGIIYAKDILTLLKEPRDNMSIRELMRPAYFTPEIKKVDNLLREMQQKRISMAIVVDEYGGTDGLITIEDIIEEIVGEIEDEYDEKISSIEQIDNNTFLVNARMNIEDVNSCLDTTLPVDECETIGGFVYGLIGRIPAQGEEVKVDSLSIIVDKIHRRMIKRLKIRKLGQTEEKKSEDKEEKK